MNKRMAQRLMLSYYDKTALPKISPRAALKKLLSMPNWKQLVRDHFSGKRVEEKQAGKAGILGIPITLAIMTLAQFTGAQTAEDLIQKVDNITISQQGSQINNNDIKQLEEAIPFPVNRVELGALRVGMLPYGGFQTALRRKIRSGMEDNILPFLDSHEKFSNLPKNKVSEYIAKAFIQKINNPQFSKEKNILLSYLERRGGSLEDLKKIAYEESIKLL